jgi:hypothetical protein
LLKKLLKIKKRCLIMCKIEIIAEQPQEKVVVLNVNGVTYAVTKECLPKETFQSLFPDLILKKWECIPRVNLLANNDIAALLEQKKIGTVNCCVRRLN